MTIMCGGEIITYTKAVTGKNQEPTGFTFKETGKENRKAIVGKKADGNNKKLSTFTGAFSLA
jgi:hypothetical protein